MKTIFTLLTTIIIYSTAFCQRDTELIGYWESSFMGATVQLVLDYNGKGRFNSAPVEWTSYKNQLTLKEKSATTAYNYLIDGEEMRVSGGDFAIPIFFKKTRNMALPANYKVERTRDDLYEEVVANSDASSLLGLWRGAGGPYRFLNSGMVIWQGKQYRFTTSGSNMTISRGSEIVGLKWKVEGDVLWLDSESGTKKLYKNGYMPSPRKVDVQQGTTLDGGTELPPEPVQQRYYAVNPPSENTYKKNQDAERVEDESKKMMGKWCLIPQVDDLEMTFATSECISVYRDGTYDYTKDFEEVKKRDKKRSNRTTTRSAMARGYSGLPATDQTGTWSYNGEIFKIKPIDGRAISYKLRKANHPYTKDPMIVLNGHNFVTYYQKSSWDLN